MEKLVDRPEPMQEDIDKAVEQRENEKFTTETGATVDYFSAIALVNRYCQALPFDTFTEPVPQWEQRKEQVNHKIQFIVSILLPIQSPLKEEVQVRNLNTTQKLANCSRFY